MNSNFNFSLHRKLLLLVAIPLGGALVFASIQAVRHMSDVRHLQRAQAAVDFVADLGALRQAVLAERRAAADFLREPGRPPAYRGHIDRTDAAFAAIRGRLLSGTTPALE